MSIPAMIMNAPNTKDLSRDKYPRYEFRATCSLRLSDGNRLDGKATNFSLGGVFLQFNNPDNQCEPNQRGQLEIIADFQDNTFALSVPCQTVHRGDRGIGIQFELMDSDTANGLSRLIEALSHYNSFYSQSINRLLKSKYNITAFFYDILDYPWERHYRQWRPKLLNDVRGRVLEIGVGTGRNFNYYHPSVQLTGIDLSEQMLHRAGRRGESASCTINLYKDDAATMTSVPSSHYDWLVSFFLCCVMPDRLQPLAIQQIERVLKPGGRLRLERALKPGGRFRLLEMVYSSDPKLRRRQEVFAPFVEKVYGARFDRNTLGYLQQSQNLEITNTYFIRDDTYLVIEGRRKALE